MRLKKRSWPVAIYDKDREEFTLQDGSRFTLKGFIELPESIDQESVRQEWVTAEIPASVWIACYREAEEERPN